MMVALSFTFGLLFGILIAYIRNALIKKVQDIKDVKISDMSSAIYNRNYELMARELHNSLEKIAFEIEPKIKEIKHKMIDLGLDGALMSGSGATVFGISRSKEKLLYVNKIMREDYYKIITKIR